MEGRADFGGYKLLHNMENVNNIYVDMSVLTRHSFHFALSDKPDLSSPQDNVDLIKLHSEAAQVKVWHCTSTGCRTNSITVCFLFIVK